MAGGAPTLNKEELAAQGWTIVRGMVTLNTVYSAPLLVAAF